MDKFRFGADELEARKGYANVAFLPNLGGAGNVLIISGTGGAAVSAALDFLNDETAMLQLRSRLKVLDREVFPYLRPRFESKKEAAFPKMCWLVLPNKSRFVILKAPSQKLFVKFKLWRKSSPGCDRIMACTIAKGASSNLARAVVTTRNGGSASGKRRHAGRSQFDA